jgi:predicted metal-dependent phosphoesterase TrpH
VIDLHLHTTASDGRLSPDDLVRAARSAGLSTIAVTDHDTVAGVPAAVQAGQAAGVTVVAGIEVTAVHAGLDVHVLGYFLDIEDRELAAFLEGQRADRRRRIAEILERLASLGAPVALPLEAERPEPGRALGRPMVARALVQAGHAASIADAFDRFLSEGRPAFVPRRGASPSEVVTRIARAGGLSSYAHPGKTGRDDLIAPMVEAGLAAIEVIHPDHGADEVGRYRRLAGEFGLAATGGSDYHGPEDGRADGLGLVTLPSEDYAALALRAANRRPA